MARGLALQRHSKFDYRKQSNNLIYCGMTSLNETNQLSTIYPDISAQLCNKHVKRLSKLKGLFKDIYDDMEPEGYVLVNGVAKVIDLGHDLQLSFALENGVTILYSKTYLNEGIFINGNNLEEEIIFNAKGKHEDGIHQKIDQIKKLLKLVRKASPQSTQFYGGIIYVHSNIGEDLFGFNECFLTGLALAMILIHEQVPNYTQQSLVQLLCSCDGKLSRNIVTNLIQKYALSNMIMEACLGEQKKVEKEFQINIVNPNSDKAFCGILTYQSTKNSLNSFKTAEDEYTVESKNEVCDGEEGSDFGSIEKIEVSPEVKSLQVNLRDNHKLVFCKLDLSKDQKDDYSSKMESIRFISDFLLEKGIPRDQLINQKGEGVFPTTLRDALGQNRGLIDYCAQIKSMLGLLASRTIQFEQFLKMKYELDREYQIYDEQVDDILYKLQANNKYIQHFCVIEGEILVISMDKQYYAEVMVFLRKLINQNKLSTYRFLTTMQKTDQEAKVNDISQIMFTAMPSAGYAVYKPTQQEDSWI